MTNAGKKIACVVMGDESLLIQCSEALRDRGHDIRAIVTANAQIADWAKSHGLATLVPGKDLEAALEPYEYDWFFSIANLRLIPAAAWRKAREGAANFHDGPLPHYAGLNTPAWAILAGETRYGVTWHALTEGIDEGDISRSATTRPRSRSTPSASRPASRPSRTSSTRSRPVRLRGSRNPSKRADTTRSPIGRRRRPPSISTSPYARSAALRARSRSASATPIRFACRRSGRPTVRSP